MTKTLKSSLIIAAGATAALGVSAAPAAAAEMAEKKISASFGTSYESHFISYGADVWSAGDDLYGDEATMFAWGDIGIAVTDALSVNFGIWADVNDNVGDSLGGDIQEIDVYVGASYAVGMFSFGATYQEWNYAADTEHVIDLSVSFDDSELLPIPLSPSLVWHNRTEGNGSQEEGSALVASIGPSFALTDSLSLDIPAGVAWFLDDDFQGGVDADGYGYSFVGASLSYPLSFIDSAYGDWSVSAGVTYYMTDEDAIPNNPEDNFLTSSIGISAGF